MIDFLIDPVTAHARLQAFHLDHARQVLSPSLLRQIRAMHTGDRSRKLFQLSPQDVETYYLAEGQGWIEIVLFEGENLFLFTPKGVDALLPADPVAP